MPGRFKGKTVPIRVTIGLRKGGEADHPDWSRMPMVTAENPETEHMSGGWIYDKSSGHGEHTADSPAGQQFGLLFVSEAFADQAVQTFPGIVEIISSESELETFLDDRCLAHMPDVKLDNEVLVGLNAELSLLQSLGRDTSEVAARIGKALDPDDPSPGKRHQASCNWRAIKREREIDLSPRVRRR